MKIKKVTSVLLALVIVLGLLPTWTFADAQPAISIESKNVAISTTTATDVMLAVNLANNPKLGGLQATFTLPDNWTISDMFLFDSTTQQRSILQIYDSSQGAYKTIGTFEQNASEKKIVWTQGSADAPDADGVLCWLKCSVPANTMNGSYEIGMSLISVNYDKDTTTEHKNDVTVTSATVTVTGGAEPAPDTVEISGGPSTSVAVPTKAEYENSGPITLTYSPTVKNQNGGVMTGQTVEWKVYKGTGGSKTEVTDTTKMSISGGIVTITNKAEAGDYTVRATCGSATPAEKTFTLEKAAAEATSVSFNNDAYTGDNAALINPPSGDAISKVYDVEVLDQYGDLISNPTLSWEFSPSLGTIAGVAFDVDSKTLTVQNSSTTTTTEDKNITVLVKAQKSGEEYTAPATQTLTVKRAASIPTTISPDNATIPVEGGTPNTTTLEVYDQYGTKITSGVTWSIEGSVAGVTINSETGELTITNTTENPVTGNSVTVKAALTSDSTKSATQNISLRKIQFVSGDNSTGTVISSIDQILNVFTSGAKTVTYGDDWGEILGGRTTTAVTGVSAWLNGTKVEGTYKIYVGDTEANLNAVPTVAGGPYTVTVKFTDDAETHVYNNVTVDSGTVTVAPKSINGATIADISNQTYNGNEQKPEPVVKDTINGVEKNLAEGTDYTVTYSNNTNAGTAVVTITGKGNYDSTTTATKNFTINKANHAPVEYTYNIYYGDTSEKTVSINDFFGTTPAGATIGTLKSDNIALKDIIADSYPTNTKFKLKSDLTGTGATDTEAAHWDLNITGCTNYNDFTATVRVKLVDITFKVGDTDVSNTLSNVLNVKGTPVYGDTWADILGSGIFKDTLTATVNGSSDSEQNNFSVKIGTTDYSGSVRPNADTYTVKVLYNGTIGSQSYSDVLVASDTVTVDQREVTLSWPATTTFTYDGSAKSVEATIGNTVGNDTVTATYTETSPKLKSATNVGNYTSEITALTNPNYKLPTPGTSQVWSITRATPVASHFNISSTTATYDGNAKTVTASAKTGLSGMGEASVKYKKGDEAATTTAPTNAGTYQILVSVAQGSNYADATDLAVGTLTISPKDIADSSITVGSIEAVNYNGEEQKPNVSVTDSARSNAELIKGTDYTVSYSNNINAGTNTAVVTITGTGNYTGTKTANFTINRVAASVATAPVKVENLTFNNADQTLVSAGTPTGGTMRYAVGASVPTANSDDWKTTLPTGKNAGTYKVWYKVVGDSNHTDYTATTPVSVSIEKASISGATVTGLAASYEYTVSPIKPPVMVQMTLNGKTVTLEANTSGQTDKDYAISYASNTGVGTATITITGNNNYTGEVSPAPTFAITAAPVKSGVKISVTDGTGEANKVDTGDTLTAVLSGELKTLADAGTSNVTYQWKRDGVAISGATNSVYTLTAEDSGKKITVTVTATEGKNYTGSATSDAVEVGKAPITTVVDTVEVSGIANVGATLTATAKTGGSSGAEVTVTSDNNITYQWLRDGQPISGANNATYTVTDADRGCKLSVKVVPTTAGATTLTGEVVSAETDAVPAAAPVANSTTAASTNSITVSLKANANGAKVLGYKVTLKNNSGQVVQVIQVPAGQENVTFEGLTQGTAYTVEVVATNSQGDSVVQPLTVTTTTPSNPYRPNIGGSSNYTSYVPETSYSVSASKTSAKNGTVKLSTNSAKAGTTVTVTVTPDNGYVLGTLTVKDATGKTLAVTDNRNGTYSFEMPKSKVSVDAQFVKGTASAPALPFVDVSTSAYYYDAVAWAVENGITGGMTDTTFVPNATCTRSQVVTFLWRAMGQPEPRTTVNPFTDISADSYYYKAVLWAYENGITGGNSPTTFNPYGPCTRGQVVTFLWRTEGQPIYSGASFSDVTAGTYYYDAVAWAVGNGITNGTGANTFSPTNPCTRGQIVAFLYRDLA